MNTAITKALNTLPDVRSTENTKGDVPAVYLFTPDASATWIIWEYEPSSDTGFGFMDLGVGMGEMGYVSIAELGKVRGHFGLPVEMDARLDTREKGYANINVPVPSYLQ